MVATAADVHASLGARFVGTSVSAEDVAAERSGDAPLISQAKVLLLGMGADEQLAGYARHRTRFRDRGWAGMHRELQLDMQRIWTRNLGRDDRCCSDHGRETRLPFLDERLVSFISALPIELVSVV